MWRGVTKNARGRCLLSPQRQQGSLLALPAPEGLQNPCARESLSLASGLAAGSAAWRKRMRLFYRGDLDGFFGLALDNLVQLLLIEELCKQVLGFPAELLYSRVLPGAAVSLLVGNLFYAWQAHRLAARTGRSDVCALPYGINTVSLIAHVFLVMLPVTVATGDPYAAWRMGLVACLGSGLIELVGSIIAEPIRKATPRAALLSTLAGIALGFISGGFLLRTFAHPVVGLTTFGI